MDRIQYVSKTLGKLNLSESEAAQSFDSDMLAYELLNGISDQSAINYRERTCHDNKCSLNIDVSCNETDKLKTITEGIEKSNNVITIYQNPHSVHADMEDNKLSLKISN